MSAPWHDSEWMREYLEPIRAHIEGREPRVRPWRVPLICHHCLEEGRPTRLKYFKYRDDWLCPDGHDDVPGRHADISVELMSYFNFQEASLS